MTRPLGSKPALCALAIAALAAPVAMAADGPSTGGAQAPPAPQTEGVIRAEGPQIALSTRAGAMLRKRARFRGTAAGAAGRTVTIERFDAGKQGWTAVADTTVKDDGTYVARWRTRHAGVFRIRAVLQAAGQATAASASPELAISVHRPAMATWYGPGFYGRTTACGVRMSRTLLGVAHKKLPCGTQVAVLYKGHRITVPVVDRGPFRRGTRYDLTAATAQALRFEHTDRLGAIRMRTTG
ncbi:MAG TPA: septal ring lytic transglycosylase RlpA family protein [Solirubrobacteraceae bacterium]|nr:septal ring lytic transglycosylase RlpA family protein [Solirubrobacteraceae bacterium]